MRLHFIAKVRQKTHKNLRSSDLWKLVELPSWLWKQGVMGTQRRNLSVLLCLLGAVSGRPPQTAGPCLVRTEEASFNCSQRRLTEIPSQIWVNATTLDLSQNNLNLTNPQTLRKLQRLDSLVLLNLSGNYLPLLDRETFSGLRSLQLLDLSRCQLVDIKSGALHGFPKLEILYLGDNRLGGPLPTVLKDLPFLDLQGSRLLRTAPPEWLKGGHDTRRSGDSDIPTLTNTADESVQNKQFLKTFHRMLLAEEEKPGNNTTPPEVGSGHGWQYLVAALGTALSISAFIVLVAKCKLFHRYVASYRHTLLSEADAASQSNPAGLGVGYAGNSMDGRGPNPGVSTELDDDDGFIEDNYIQASERERAQRETEVVEELSEDDEMFSIT